MEFLICTIDLCSYTTFYSMIAVAALTRTSVSLKISYFHIFSYMRILKQMLTFILKSCQDFCWHSFFSISRLFLALEAMSFFQYEKQQVQHNGNLKCRVEQNEA